MATPSAARSRKQRVHVRLGGDVDAAGRLVDDQQRRSEREPAGQHDLLLIAAGKGRDGRVETRGPQVEGGGESLEPKPLAPPVERAAEAVGV